MEYQETRQWGEDMSSLHTIIVEQKKEIERLQERLKQEQFAEQLRVLLTSSEANGLVLSPFSRTQFLELIVQTAAHFLHARSSSLFLIDEEAQELIFEVAMGPASAEVKKFRVPLGHGIAGLVALTGQPIAIANAHEDSRLATDIAFAVNYVPSSILCMPLFYDDRVIGVLELFDKQTSPTFSAEDLDISARFATIAAVAIAQANAFLDQETFFRAMIRAFSGNDLQKRQRLSLEVAGFTHWANTTDLLNARARELALYVHELILDGEQSCNICVNMLQSIVAGVRERRRLQVHLSTMQRVPQPSGW